MTASEMSGACFSPDHQYRHILWRVWDDTLPKLMLLMLNPSKAGETENDPTVTRQIKRAGILGFGGLYVCNIFDLVATDPREMKRHQSPNSAENNAHILRTAILSGMIICAWGTHGTHRGRDEEIRRLLVDFKLYALRITKTGQPEHPLYIGYDVKPVKWKLFSAQ